MSDSVITYDRDQVAGLLPHGGEFQLLDRVRVAETDGIYTGTGYWYVDDKNSRRLAGVEDGPFDLTQPVHLSERVATMSSRILTPLEWEPFKGHYPDPIGPITPGVFSLKALAELSWAAHGFDTSKGFGIESLEKIRWRGMLVPGDEVELFARNFSGKDPDASISKKDGDGSAVEVSGLVVVGNNGDILVPAHALLEFSAQVVGTTVLSSLDPDGQRGAPLFLGLDDVDIFGQVRDEEYLQAIVKTKGIPSGKRAGKATAEVFSVERTGKMLPRKIMTVGNLIFGIPKPELVN